MRRILACTLALFAFAAAPAGFAQTLSDMGRALRTQPPTDAWSAGLERNSSIHWHRCMDVNSEPARQAIRSCGRLIGERISRTITARAHFQRARHYQRSGDPAHAQADFDRARDLFDQEVLANANSAQAYYHRASFLAHIDDYDGAVRDLGKAIELDPDWDGPHYRLGQIHFRRGAYADSAAAYDQAARLDPDDAYNQAGRCEARAAAGIEPDTAAAACAQAVEQSEAEDWALVSRGYLHFMRGELDAAGADFAAALDAEPDSPEARYGRGVVAMRQGRIEEGQADIAAAGFEDDDARAFYANAGLRP